MDTFFWGEVRTPFSSSIKKKIPEWLDKSSIIDTNIENYEIFGKVLLVEVQSVTDSKSIIILYACIYYICLFLFFYYLFKFCYGCSSINSLFGYG